MRPMNVIALIVSIAVIISLFMPFVSLGSGPTRISASVFDIERSAAAFIAIFAVGAALICMLEERLAGLAAMAALSILTIAVLLHEIGYTAVWQAIQSAGIANVLGAGAYLFAAAALVLFGLGIADHHRPNIG